MQQTFHLVSDPSFLYTSNRNINIPSNYTRSFSPVHHRNSQLRVQKLILCSSNRRNGYGIGKSGKLMFETACIIASKLGFVPEPLGLMLGEFGADNRGGNGFWNGFGWNGFDGWKRRRSAKLGMVGILAICGVVGMWLVLDADALFGGLGLIMFGAKDCILGFCCCAFLWWVWF
ncbi:hypothetical protein PHJA_002861000 [Phtheirospermum japonicum]|uniref:Transmembrane protein n=1 Tax=Phtheirospermum japonicum TaxID=374723 RepID=A0A830DBR9_9LAMI|nr:hypothetical protein PHJA_002861000 [Phtheirospermum japonicum]